MGKPKLGATNQFPRGKFNQYDEGELRVSIGVKDKTVIIDFGTSTAWIGLDKKGAIDFANAIIDKAESIE